MDTREAFEAWYSSEIDASADFSLDGEYYDDLDVQAAWRGWKAAIAHAVPEGCVVVPKEPTDDMVMAGWSVEELVTPNRTWEAMIAAAPAQGEKE